MSKTWCATGIGERYLTPAVDVNDVSPRTFARSPDSLEGTIADALGATRRPGLVRPQPGSARERAYERARRLAHPTDRVGLPSRLAVPLTFSASPVTYFVFFVRRQRVSPAIASVASMTCQARQTPATARR